MRQQKVDFCQLVGSSLISSFSGELRAPISRVSSHVYCRLRVEIWPPRLFFNLFRWINELLLLKNFGISKSKNRHLNTFWICHLYFSLSNVYLSFRWLSSGIEHDFSQSWKTRGRKLEGGEKLALVPLMWKIPGKKKHVLKRHEF